MMRALLFALLIPAPAFAQAAQQDIYTRLQQRIAADPGLAEALGKPAPEMAQVAWMIGTWDVETVVDIRPDASEHGTSVVSPLFGGVWLEARDTYPRGTQGVVYIEYDPAIRAWRSVSFDNVGTANIVTAAAGWEGNRLIFEGDYMLLGAHAHLRRVITRLGDDAYRVDHEELIGGVWKHHNSYNYTRKPPP